MEYRELRQEEEIEHFYAELQLLYRLSRYTRIIKRVTRYDLWITQADTGKDFRFSNANDQFYLLFGYFMQPNVPRMQEPAKQRLFHLLSWFLISRDLASPRTVIVPMAASVLTTSQRINIASFEKSKVISGSGKVSHKKFPLLIVSGVNNIKAFFSFVRSSACHSRSNTSVK